MAVWELSTEYKKNAIEVQLWYKDGVTIKRIEGYRWGTFYCESDEHPDIDLRNEGDGYELADYDWELDSLDDGCWADWEFPDSMSEEERNKIEEAWDNEWYEGVEALGWSQDDTEYWFQGPLKLVNKDTGEEFSVLDADGNIKPEEDTVSQAELEAGLEELKREFEELTAAEEDPPLTDWFPSEVNPVREGRYIVSDNKNPHWPFPTYAEWDGKKWNNDSIAQWRGLAEDPNK
jgi:hypothetical protein